MKIARFSTGNDPRYGIVDGDDLVVLSGDPMFSGFDTTGERVPLESVKLLAPVIPRSKIIGVGLNYGPADDAVADGADDVVDSADDVADGADAVADGADAVDRSVTPADPRGAPILFLKPNTAIVGPGDAIQLPPVDGRICHEGELAIVIGRVAKQVKAEDFANYVFGYTIANDVTARGVLEIDGQWARAKGYDTFCPLGPVIETELDASALEITTFVDGEPRLQGNTSDMIHGIAELVAFASDIWTLLPGDIILTGTPSGAGEFVGGQTVEITIEGIGTLSNPARDRA